MPAVDMNSGVGQLFLTITNIPDRMVDRTRQTVAELNIPGVKREKIKLIEIKIFMALGKCLKYFIAWLITGMIASSLILPLVSRMNLAETDLITIGYPLLIISIFSVFSL